ncbi:MAG: FHA domain-containing protein [Planctomycetota bacterium]|jgi:response regulator RpfG family c-di-GMP phosphodiesterase|nr:FHA domain-containing protein [Planctomycetota bacterium]
MVGIRIRNGPTQGQTFAIRGEPLIVGRDAACDVPLQDKGASRRHAELFRIGEMCFIRDLDSRNGSFVNDARISEEMLRDGDRIQIGGTIMTFEATSADQSSPALEFSEEELGDFYELRLEDLTSVNVGGWDASSEQHLRALYRFSRLAASEESEESLIRKALTFIAESFHADGSYLFGRDLEQGGVVTLGSYIPKGRSGQLSRTIIRKVMQDKRALLVTDAMRDDRFSSNESVMKHNIHAVICAPLALSGDLQGVLYIAGDDPAVSFNEQELELAAAMADQIGLVLSHIASRQVGLEYTRSALRLMLEVADASRPGTTAQNTQIAAYMVAIGKALKLKSAELENLQLAGILYNYADLAYASREATAPDDAARLLANEPFFAEIEDTIKFQREKYDGSGPAGLSGGDVPFGVRIFQAARDLESVCSPARGDDIQGLDDAVQGIVDKSGRLYDPSVTAALQQACKAGLLALTLDEQWQRGREFRLATGS